MKKVDAYQLLDGTVVVGLEQAIATAKAKYGLKLTGLSNRIISKGDCKYHATTMFIDENLKDFEELINLAKDIENED